jgi:hypothetical protein
MKLPKMPFSIQALVLANIMPLIGILFFGWDAAVIVLLYWTENIVIGFYNILKMTLLKLSFDPGKLFAIPFFCLHFGGFCAVHGFFLLAFFKLGGGMESFFPKEAWPGPLVFIQLLFSVVSSLWRNHPVGMEWPVIGLFVSHGISFVQNYLLKKEYASLTIAKLMNQPYKRIVILHVTIIAGGVPIMLIGSPVPLMCILVLLKVSMDIYLHKKEHKVNIDEKIEPSNPLDSEIAA